MFKIYNEDCLEGMKNIPDGAVEFILTDLPYGITDLKYDKKKMCLEEMWTQFKRIIKPCSVIALFGSARFSYELYNSNPAWYKYKWIWVKNMVTGFAHAKNAPMRKFEEILIFSNGSIQHSSLTVKRMKYFPQGIKFLEKGYFRHKKKLPDSVYNHKLLKPYYQKQTNYPTDVLFYDTPCRINRPHPNAKPVDLLEYLIRTYTNEGELVLDCCMGSGSTGVAAINTGRKFIGYELDKNYFEIANKRITEAFQKKSEGLFLLKGGESNGERKI